MINGRWVESHEIFDKLPELQNSESKADQPSLSLVTGNHLSAVDFVTSAVREDRNKGNDQGKVWKEIRFRDVLLSQTENELSLIQVCC